MDSPTYTKAIERCLAELQWAQIHRISLQGIEAADPVHHYFLHSTYHALFNDYLAHCIKVLDLSRGTASFWYIRSVHSARVDGFATKSGFDVAEIREVSERLRHVRDKTHFHIDKTGVMDTRAIWRDAGITGKRLATVVDWVWEILNHLQRELGLKQVTLPSYSIESAKAAALAADRSSAGDF